MNEKQKSVYDENLSRLSSKIDQSKKLVFQCQDIDCKMDYPNVKEIADDDRNNGVSISSLLGVIRGNLEHLDRMVWDYKCASQKNQKGTSN